MNKTREDSSDRHNNNIEEPKLGIFVDGKRLDNVFVWVMGKKIWLVLRRRWFADFLMMQYCWQSETVAQIKKVRQRWNEDHRRRRPFHETKTEASANCRKLRSRQNWNHPYKLFSKFLKNNFSFEMTNLQRHCDIQHEYANLSVQLCV